MESAGLRRLEDGVLAEASCSSHQLVSFFKVWLKALDQLTVTQVESRCSCRRYQLLSLP